MHLWLKTTMSKLSKKSELAKAIFYALDRWSALTRFVDDGRIEMDNNIANAARGICGIMPSAGLCRVDRIATVSVCSSATAAAA